MTTKTLSAADRVLKEIESHSKRSFLPIIGPVKGKYLTEAVHQYHIHSVLEIGTLIGYSAILIAKGLPEEGKVATIEINPQSARIARENVREAKLTDKITIITGNALDIIPGIQDEFDMVFIDAAKDEYFDYLKLSEPKLKKNGIVFADNVKMFAGQMRNFLEYIRTSGKYRSRYIDVGFDGVEISQKLY